MSDEPQDLEDMLGRLQDAAEKGEGAMSVGEMLDVFDSRSFGALLTLIALLAMIPIVSAIPGFSILTGSLLILVAGQYLLGRPTPWIPEKLRSVSVGRETMCKAVAKSKPYAARIDQYLKPRLQPLTTNAVSRMLIALATIALALSFYPLALIPGGVTIPAVSIVALGLALVARDGVLALIGGGGVAASFAAVGWLFL